MISSKTIAKAPPRRTPMLKLASFIATPLFVPFDAHVQALAGRLCPESSLIALHAHDTAPLCESAMRLLGSLHIFGERLKPFFLGLLAPGRVPSKTLFAPGCAGLLFFEKLQIPVQCKHFRAEKYLKLTFI
ncbi:hypothetical protein [Herbaspirillum huttiense]|uniref:Uncharacterized protein n=2 Tax=Herbaspirillum huttiense TaxID=863372 RepID=A0AAJ2LVL1_9BURK|nr:hypothetical protein [Herbaspirillum huttiense]MDR9837136.1 hypothetical protein [Herbaspirillum huttiense]